LALVTAHVRSKGFKVVEASDGDMAWKLAHEHLPDLVILDVMMPGMSGWEVCRKIRESLPLAHTGVIMLTGIGEHLNEMTSPLYGADTHVDKPFEFSDLDDKIEDTLRSRREGAFGRPDHADEISAEDDEDALDHVPAVTQPSPPLSDAMEADVTSEPPAVVSITAARDDDYDEDDEPTPKKPVTKKAAAKKAAAKKAAKEPAAKKASTPVASGEASVDKSTAKAKKATKKAASKPAKKAVSKPAKKASKKVSKPAKKASKKAASKPAKKASKKATKKTPVANSAKKAAKKAARHPTTKKAAKKRR
jgi:CheY-like chemotaxis protein